MRGGFRVNVNTTDDWGHAVVEMTEPAREREHAWPYGRERRTNSGSGYSRRTPQRMPHQCETSLLTCTEARSSSEAAKAQEIMFTVTADGDWMMARHEVTLVSTLD